MLPHQTLSVHTAGGGRTLRGLQQAVPALLLYLAGILAAEVEAGKVVRTLPVIETLAPPGSTKLIDTTPALGAFYGASPAGYQSITLEAAGTGADRAGRPAPVLPGPAHRPRPARVGRAQGPGPRPSRPVQPFHN